MTKNYYEILGIDDDCSFDDIKSAYRKLAIKWHPDKNKNDKATAEIKFKEISKAYQVLSDSDLRKNYDKHGVTSNDVDNLIDPYDMFKHLFENDNEIPNVIVKIDASIDDLYMGFTKSATYTRYSSCRKCNSTGTYDKSNGSCNTCKGMGMLMETIDGGKMGYMINEKQCNLCEGTGMNPEIKKCKKCEGVKYIKENIECDVNVPPGAYDNYCIKLENEGNYIPYENRLDNNNDRSDVLFIIKDITPKNSHIKRGMYIPELGRINMADILIDIDVSYENALCGLCEEFDYIAGKKISIDTSEIIQNNDIYVIRNYGMKLVPEEQNKTSKTYGDLFVRFKVKKPKLDKMKIKRIWQIITGTAYQTKKEIADAHDIIDFQKYVMEEINYSNENNDSLHSECSDDSYDSDINK